MSENNLRELFKVRFAREEDAKKTEALAVFHKDVGKPQNIVVDKEAWTLMKSLQQFARTTVNGGTGSN